MVLSCVVKGCPSVWGCGKIGFYGVPSVIRNQGSQTESVSLRRRSLWLDRINRPDLSEKPGKYNRVCAKHFIQGHPAKLFDESNPDWLPNINLPCQTQSCLSTTGGNAFANELIVQFELDPSLQEEERKRQAEDSDVTISKRLRLPPLENNAGDICVDSGDLTSADAYVAVPLVSTSDLPLTTRSDVCVLNDHSYFTPPVNFDGNTSNMAFAIPDGEQSCPVTTNAVSEVPLDNHSDIATVESTDNDVSIAKPELLPHCSKSVQKPVLKPVQKSVQTELHGAEIERLNSQIRILQSKVMELESENKTLHEKAESFERVNLSLQSENDHLNSLKNIPFDQESFKDNDFKVKFYTGLPTYSLLISIFEFVGCKIPHSHRNALSKFCEFILTMMRLRLGLLEQDLAFRFNISQPAVCTIFDKWIHMMSTRLSKLIEWPERDILHATMPNCFQEVFGNRIAVIIDCFEMFIERPSSLEPRAETWSNYKHHNTVKYLIGITPQGTICFISRGWGGRASDKCITLHSGFLDKLVPGDVVMADRGFTISEEVGMCRCELSIPAFTKGKSQLPSEDVHNTRVIANVRIHVERLIGLLKNKFHIFDKVLPISFLRGRFEGDEAFVDHLVRVCCALINLCPPIVEPDTDNAM